MASPDRPGRPRPLDGGPGTRAAGHANQMEASTDAALGRRAFATLDAEDLPMLDSAFASLVQRGPADPLALAPAPWAVLVADWA